MDDSELQLEENEEDEEQVADRFEKYRVSALVLWACLTLAI